LTLASVLASVLVLGGCGVPIIVGTAGVAGTGTVAVDKRTFGTMVEDEGIEWKVRAAINEADLKEDDRHNVKVTSFNRVVLLTGQVPDEEAKGKAAAEAGRIEQVRGVHNELVVGPPTKLSRRSADTVVTGRVKVAVAANSDLKPPANVNNKVVTEDGVVFLMGLVTREEAEAITASAQSVPGIRQIVRLFEYPDS
jgi:osmotically-inducible protein OsmY